MAATKTCEKSRESSYSLSPETALYRAIIPKPALVVRPHMRRIKPVLIFLILVSFLYRVAHAQVASGPTSTKAPAPNLLADAARSVGALQCLPAIERLSGLVVSGASAHEVLIDWDRKKPGTSPLFSLIGITFQDSVAAASITAVPQPGGDCAVAAERISIAPFNCKNVAQTELKGYQATILLPTFTVYTSSGDPGASVSLIDSTPNCLIIRRHVQYGWRDPSATTRVP